MAPYVAVLEPELRAALADPLPEVRATAAKALGSLLRGMGPSHFQNLLPWLLDRLKSEVGNSPFCDLPPPFFCPPRASLAAGRVQIRGGTTPFRPWYFFLSECIPFVISLPMHSLGVRCLCGMGSNPRWTNCIPSVTLSSSLCIPCVFIAPWTLGNLKLVQAQQQ